MLRPQQFRQIVILGFLLLVAVALLFAIPRLIQIRDLVFQTASNPVPPTADEAPPPPPSPFPPGAVILDGALQDVKDFTPMEEVYREPAYLRLVRHVAALPEDSLRETSEGEVAYATFLKYAPELRGRTFKLSGEAMQDIHAERLSEPVQGREDTYRIFLVDPGWDAGFVCDLVDRPGEQLSQRDPIEMEGKFYKVVRWQNVRKQDRDYPLFVGRSFRRVPPAPETKKSQFQFFLELGIGIAIVAMLLIAYFLTQSMARQRTARPSFGSTRRGPAGGKPAIPPRVQGTPPGSPEPPKPS